MFKKLLSTSAVIALVATTMSGSAYAYATCPKDPNAPKPRTKVMSPSVGKKVQKAFDAYSEERIDDAITILLSVETSKEYDRAYLDRFIANMYATKGGDFSKKALPYLASATKNQVLNEKEHADTVKLLGDLQMQEQQYTKAIKTYADWMAFSCEEDANTYVKIANAYYSLKQYDKIIAPANKAIALFDKPNQNPYILKLQSYYERKQYKPAVKVLEEVVQLFPENKQWWTQLGMFYTLVEDYKKALYTLDMAYKQGYLEKESEIKMLASLYGQNEVPYKSAKLLEKYIDSGLIQRTEQNMFTMANAFHAAQEIDTAAKYFGETAKMSNDPKHYRRQGMLLHQSERFSEATAALQKALDLGIENKGSVYMTIAEAYFYQEKYTQAARAIAEAQKDPKTAKAARAWAQFIRDTADRKKKLG
ncbi:tetratricopeptide repeat protein [Thalassotalea maritima]|uniref:tetratricopeptide repeat protein n=1 Tax=Thalassotalea maritima TaxID=3242416 RepID=UPI00352996A3